MTDAEGLFAAILADPEDDTPRLVYADWLEEHGDPERAEFIRVQIKLARLPTADLESREEVLLARHEEEWLSPLKARGAPLEGGAAGAFRRGFVEVVWMPATAFLDRAQELFARAPVLELRVTRATPDEFHWLMQSPRLARLRGLDLSDRRLGDPAVVELARSQFTATLRTLRLRACDITDRGAHILVHASPTWDLRELDLSFNPISREWLAALRDRYGVALVGWSRTIAADDTLSE
jgi:uncharacterized protein (TIGR02996 family)